MDYIIVYTTPFRAGSVTGKITRAKVFSLKVEAEAYLKLLAERRVQPANVSVYQSRLLNFSMGKVVVSAYIEECEE